MWEIWKIFNDVSLEFCTLASTLNPSSADDELEVLEYFVVLLHDDTSTETNVNKAQKQLSSQKGRSSIGLSSTKAALVEHTKRAVYQKGHIWAWVFVAVLNLPYPGQQPMEAGWEVKWTALSETYQASRKLPTCGCKKGCRRQCKYAKAVLQCTALSLCGGLHDCE